MQSFGSPDDADMDDCQPKDLSVKSNVYKKLKPIPPPLNLSLPNTALKEFAIIATSPKSPLMQKNLPFRKRAYSFCGTNDPFSSPNSIVGCSSLTDTLEKSSLSSLEEECLPSPSYLPSPIPFRVGAPLTKARIAHVEYPRQLCPSVLLSPAPSSPGSGSREELHSSKLCVLSPDICDRFKRFSFPPEEISSPSSSFISPPSSPTKKVLDPDRPKRPMNAFMLFAKRYRLELIQMHPGRDNRAISVILGEAWRNLKPEDKEVFVAEARLIAQEQKRLHPDCWKRKRSHSTS